MAGEGVEALGAQQRLGVRVPASQRLVLAEKVDRGRRDQFGTMGQAGVKTEYERRKFWMRRPLIAIVLEPAVEQNADRTVRFVEPRRGSDFMVAIDESPGCHAEPRQHAQATNDLNMVAKIFRRDFERREAPWTGAARGFRSRRHRWRVVILVEP